MIVIPLQSGSNGNCIYVEARGVRLLFDAGVSGRCAETRLAAFGRDIRDVDALVISHDHIDHARSAGIFQRKFGVPIHVTEATLATADAKYDLGRLSDVRLFRSGAELVFDGVRVQTLPTPHDGVDGSVFLIEAGRKRLGILTDLGHVFGGLASALAGLDAVVLESNYDPHMLETGPYPAFLKRRIRGAGGHLSNDEAAGLLAGAGGRLKWACLAHLSEQNNTPDRAMQTHRAVLGSRFKLHLADRHRAVGPLKL